MQSLSVPMHHKSMQTVNGWSLQRVKYWISDDHRMGLLERDGQWCVEHLDYRDDWYTLRGYGLSPHQPIGLPLHASAAIISSILSCSHRLIFGETVVYDIADTCLSLKRTAAGRWKFQMQPFPSDQSFYRWHQCLENINGEHFNTRSAALAALGEWAALAAPICSLYPKQTAQHIC